MEKLIIFTSFRYLYAPTSEGYKAAMEKRGLQPEIVSLPHNAEGYWLGNKNAKKVVVFYHGVYNSISVPKPRSLGRVTKPRYTFCTTAS